MSSGVRHAWSQLPVQGLLAVIGAMTLLACGPEADRITSPLDVAVGLAIVPPALSLIVGDEERLTGRAYNAKDGTTNATFTWSSADTAIATVGRTDGIVTAISAGNTTVTASAGALRATATVSVRPTGPAISVAISPSELGLIAGGVERLTARASDSTGRTTSASFEWSSADLAIATVGRTDGIIAAIAAGSTTITVAAGALRATATVSVIALAGSFAFTRGTSSSAGDIRFQDITFDVLTFSAADRTPRSLPRPAQFASIAAPAWSPDGALLAVEVIHAYFPYDWHDYNSDLFVLSAAAPAGAPWRALTTNGLSRSPSWSPDGKRIAYLQQTELWAYRNDLYVIDAAGSEPVRVTRTSGEYSLARWSPDGTRLAFSSAEGNNSEIFIVNADGSGLTNVTRNSAWDEKPSWSPDGSRLTFVSSNRDGTARNAFVVDADGRNVRRLPSLSGYCWEPACSPDGRHIIFSSDGALHVMNADGSSLVRLTMPPPGSWDSAPVWIR